LGSSEQAEKTKMNTVTIGVASISDTRRRASAAFRGKKQCARISFASEDLPWKTLTPKRWALLKLMARQGSMAIRDIARRADRDVRAVHSDIHVLLRAGILEKLPSVALSFLMTPYTWISC
jgi:predicted transcriptional regulator